MSYFRSAAFGAAYFASAHFGPNAQVQPEQVERVRTWGHNPVIQWIDKRIKPQPTKKAKEPSPIPNPQFIGKGRVSVFIYPLAEGQGVVKTPVLRGATKLKANIKLTLADSRSKLVDEEKEMLAQTLMLMLMEEDDG